MDNKEKNGTIDDLFRMRDKEQEIYEFNVSQANKMVNEISSKLYGGNIISAFELKKLSSLAYQYRNILFNNLDKTIHFHYKGHEDYAAKIKRTYEQCIKKLDSLIPAIESKIKWKEDAEDRNLSEIREINIKAVQKIAFLHELGITEFLINKLKKETGYYNANIIGKLVSRFTGINEATAIRNFNSILSEESHREDYPLKEERIRKIRNSIRTILDSSL